VGAFSTDAPVPSVAICVATHRRPSGLARLLKGLDALAFYGGAPPSITIVVVDNDPARSAATTFENFSATGRWPLVYVSEPRRGIPFARNAAVNSARQLGAELLAFIDDDEVPEPAWLEELMRVMRESGAEIVTGPVLPAFEEDVPRWIVRGRFFDRERHGTGTFQERAVTGNVLLRTDLLAGMPAPFDETKPLSGGTDTHLFRRLVNNGCRIAWADEAIVYEWNPASRLTARWLVRRSYRVSSNWSSTESELRPGMRVGAARAAKALLRIGQGLMLLPVGLVAGRHVLVKSAQLMATGAGFLAGMAGREPEEYRVTHGG
jgi:glycosyltransferase involved in cell wall biosynthesis